MDASWRISGAICSCEKFCITSGVNNSANISRIISRDLTEDAPDAHCPSSIHNHNSCPRRWSTMGDAHGYFSLPLLSVQSMRSLVHPL